MTVYLIDGFYVIDNVKVPSYFFKQEVDKEYFSMTDLFPGVFDKGLITERKITMIKNKYLESQNPYDLLLIRKARYQALRYKILNRNFIDISNI